MPTIIAPSGNHAHANPDAAARHRADRLAKATPEQIEQALAYLSMIDPEAFEIAFTAVTTSRDEDREDGEEPIPVCRRCGAMIGIFPDHSLQWRHYVGDATTTGTQQVYNPGHAAQVIWILPGEGLEEL